MTFEDDKATTHLVIRRATRMVMNDYATNCAGAASTIGATGVSILSADHRQNKIRLGV